MCRPLLKTRNELDIRLDIIGLQGRNVGVILSGNIAGTIMGSFSVGLVELLPTEQYYVAYVPAQLIAATRNCVVLLLIETWSIRCSRWTHSVSSVY